MCGIIGIISKQDINVLSYLLNGLKQLQNRGYDSAGLSIIDNGNFLTKKFASTNSCNSLQKLENEMLDVSENKYCNIGMGHTRWATHGGKTDNNSHPHISYDNNVILVHNGVIENYNELKKELMDKGIEFKSQTDTEVIVNMIAYYYKTRPFDKAIGDTMNRLEGTWGLVIICVDTPNKLYCIRKGSPLLISNNEDYVIISSEQSGFNGIVSNYFILDGDDLCEIELINNNLNIKTNNTYKLRDTVKDNFDLSPEPYPHWTMKEINEQYDASLRAITFGGRLLDKNNVKLGGLEGHTEILKRIDNIIFLACGTSYHAAMIGMEYFKDLCNFNTVMLFDGAEFNKKDIPKIGNTALIFLSQSGETKDLHRCIEVGKNNDLFLIGIVNVVDSMIAREVNCGVYLNAGREVGVASTKCFTNQVIVLSLISIWFSQIHNINELKRSEYITNLRKLPLNIKNTVENCFKCIPKFINIINKENLFVLGKGKCEAIAKEGALKIKEISYIHAEGYSGSALKHGPFALLTKDFPVILVASYDTNFAKMLNVYEEIKSRHSPIIFITNASNQKTSHIKNVIEVENNSIFSDLLSVIPLQIISYSLSIANNLNPDFPRNLAKSVVVE